VAGEEDEQLALLVVGSADELGFVLSQLGFNGGQARIFDDFGYETVVLAQLRSDVSGVLDRIAEIRHILVVVDGKEEGVVFAFTGKSGFGAAVPKQSDTSKRRNR